MTDGRQAAATVALFVLTSCASSEPPGSSGLSSSARPPGSEGPVPPGNATGIPDTFPPPITPEACAANRKPPPSVNGETLMWSDEFDGAAVDTSRWSIRAGFRGHGTILNTASAQNLAVREGSLFVTTRAAPEDPVHPYSSGHIDTVSCFAYTYGRVEFRARFPHANGPWYAVWAKPWSEALPEIDVEILGKSPTQVWFVNHWGLKPIPANERRKFYTVEGTDIADFHVYSITWKPSLVEWRFDGTPYMTSTTDGVPEVPLYWTINGWMGGWGGTPDPALRLPVQFEVDYFRVYAFDGLRGSPAMRVGNERAQYSKAAEWVDVQIADMDLDCAQVAMYANGKLVDTISRPPYKFTFAKVPRGHYTLAFKANDGARKVDKTMEVDVQ